MSVEVERADFQAVDAVLTSTTPGAWCLGVARHAGHHATRWCERVAEGVANGLTLAEAVDQAGERMVRPDPEPVIVVAVP